MSKLIDFIIKTIFPPNIKCIVCGDDLDSDYKYNICDRCMKQLPFITGNVCHKCGAPINDMGKVCMNCKNAGHTFASNISVFMYSEPANRFVRDLKFNNKKYLANTLGAFIVTKVIESGKKYDVVIPVPLHESKLKERGYNQSELLCEGLKVAGYNVRTDILIKKKDTAQQVGLECEQRLKNLQGVFKVVHRKDISGKVVLLVDDVITTGTTLDECAQVLISWCKQSVLCYTMSRIGFGNMIVSQCFEYN